MSEEMNATGANVSAPKPEGNEYIVTFKKPFTFENKVYDSIDLSGLEDLTGAQLCDAYRQFTKNKNQSFTPELTPAFAAIVATMVTGHPIELFYQLPAKYLNKIKTTVSNYFFEEA